jgi:hypothetical protein
LHHIWNIIATPKLEISLFPQHATSPSPRIYRAFSHLKFIRNPASILAKIDIL